MDESTRPKTKTIRVYKYERVIKATKLQIEFIQGTHGTFKVTDSKEKKIHYVRWNIKLESWHCDCWHFANRTAPNRLRWGFCSHILGLLYKKSPQEFEKEVKREVTIKC